MRKNKIKNISVALFFLALFFVSSCGQNNSQGEKAKTTSQVSTDIKGFRKKIQSNFY